MATAPSRTRLIVRLVLLGILASAALRYAQVRFAESRKPDWEFQQEVAVVLVVPRAATEDERAPLATVRDFALATSNRPTFWALKYWFDQEHGRYVDRPGFSPVRFDVVGPIEVDGPPPPPPRAGDDLSFLGRWWRTREFLGYFDDVRDRLSKKAPVTVFVYFYLPSEAAHFKPIHSVAERRSRRGFVFAPLTERGVDAALVHVAHELLHVFGATDKYDDARCVWPQGYYEPFREPRFPQSHAEVMAMGIPLQAGGRELSLDFFELMRVGVETAHEIGWIERERRDRYYAGDASAGGRPD